MRALLRVTQTLKAEPGLRPKKPVAQSRVGAAMTGRDLVMDDPSLPTHFPAPGPVPSREVSQHTVSLESLWATLQQRWPCLGEVSLITAIYRMCGAFQSNWRQDGNSAAGTKSRGDAESALTG